jgi:hypothetical protein
LFGLLVVQWRSVWPAVLAHLMHNAIAVAVRHPDGLQPLVERLGYPVAQEGLPPPTGWLVGAAVLMLVGIVLCLLAPQRPKLQTSPAAQQLGPQPAERRSTPEPVSRPTPVKPIGEALVRGGGPGAATESDPSRPTGT